VAAKKGAQKSNKTNTGRTEAAQPKQQPAAKVQPVVKEKQEDAVNAPNDIFELAGKRGIYMALGLVVLVAAVVFRDYLFGDKLFLFKDIGSDSLNTFYPLMYNTANYIEKYGLPSWSFSYGMGQNQFAFMLREPFDIFMFMLGKAHLPYGIAWKELLKVVLGGVTFFAYLRTMRLSNYTSIFGSLAFAFCGFMIVGGGWNQFSYEAFNMALLLLAFEQLFMKNKWYLFPVPVAILAIAMPFNLYVYGSYLVVYAVFRCVITDKSVKDGVVLFAKMAGLGIVGLMLAGPFLLENIAAIMESPRGGGGASYYHILSSMPMFETASKLELGTGVMRLFCSDLMGSGSNFKGWTNLLEAPMFYCGIPCVILMPQVFSFLDRKRKIVFGVFLLLWVVPTFFPYFRHTFWLFSGDYYRGYSFFVSLVFIYYATYALEQIIQRKKVNLITLVATVVISIALLNYPFFSDSSFVDSAMLTFVVFIIVVYGVILFLVPRQKHTLYLQYALLAALVLELAYFSSTTINERDVVTKEELHERVGYNDYTLDALKVIKQNDKSFYRVDKAYASSPATLYSLDDGMAQEFYGTSCYTSFNQLHYIDFLKTMGAITDSTEYATRWAMGIMSHALLESENGVKYVLTKKITNPLWKMYYDSLGTYGDVMALRNRFYLPMGYAFRQYVRKSVFDKLHYQKDLVSLRAVVVNDEDVPKMTGLTEFSMNDTIPTTSFNADYYGQWVTALRKDTMVVNKFAESSVSGTVNMSEAGLLYLTIPADNGWTLKVDGQTRNWVEADGGMVGVMLPKGSHTIAMDYHLRYYGKGLLMCLVALIIYGALYMIARRRKLEMESVTITT
jgi:hypothetical protein